MRDERLFLEDILECIHKVQKYTRDFTYENFERDDKTYDAVLRNFEIIGEAAKHLSEETLAKTEGIEWRKIKGFRDMLAHVYFGVDLDIVWEAIQEKLEPLKKEVQFLLEDDK